MNSRGGTRPDPGESEIGGPPRAAEGSYPQPGPDWERLARGVAESSISGVAMADLGGALTYVNDSFLGIWRYSDSSHVVGRNVSEFWRSLDESRQPLEDVRGAGSWKGTIEALCGDGEAREVEVSAKLIRAESGEPLAFVASFLDLSFQRSIEKALRKVQNATAAEIGTSFLERIALELGDAVQADFIEIGELANPGSGTVRASIVVQGGILARPFEYDLAGTPCETVAGRQTCYYPEGVQKLFAADRMLVDLGIEGYAGVPLWDADGRSLGLVAVLTRRPIKNPAFVTSLLEMSAGRIAAEIERKRSEAAVARRDAILTAVGFAAEQFLKEASWEDCLASALERLGEAAEVSRVYIFKVRAEAPGRWRASQTHEWCAPGIQPQLENPELLDLPLAEMGFERWQTELSAGRRISGPVSSFPASEQALLAPQGIQSLLVVPVFDGPRWWGFIGFDECTAKREWSLAETESLQTAAGILGAAIRREEAEALRKRLEAAIEQSSDGVAMTDGSGRAYYVNSAFERLARRDRGSLIGADLSATVEEDGDGLLSPEFAASMRRDGGWRGCILRREGPRANAFDVAISPVRNRQGVVAGSVAICRDVSREVELEQQVRQSQKMETVGRLAGGIAHDFNNLLCAILGYAELIKEKLPANHPAAQDVTEIVESATRASSVARQLLVFSRRPRATRKLVDVNRIASDLSKLARRLIGENISLRTDLRATLPSVTGDSTQLEQVLMNLIVNARDAMAEGGTLSIRTGQLAVSRDGKEPEKLFVVLTVEDTGTGMSERVRSHLFEPFFTTKEPGKGTGLGLATCFAIVAQHGGFIEVDSWPGRGSVFRVLLPASDEHAVPEGPGASEAALRAVGKKKILVVEDEEPIRRLVARILVERGYAVVEAPSGDAALGLDRQELTALDAVVADVVLPGIDGVTMVQRLRELNPLLRSLFISGHAADILSRHGLGFEAVSLLHKPFGPRDLLKRVEQLLAVPAEGSPSTVPGPAAD